MTADSRDRGLSLLATLLYSKGLGLCSAQFHSSLSVRLVCSGSPVPPRHSRLLVIRPLDIRLLVNNGQPLIRRIGSGSITIPSCITHTIFIRLNFIRADRTYTIGIPRRCESLPTIGLGSIFSRSRDVFTLGIISDLIFSRVLPVRMKTPFNKSYWIDNLNFGSQTLA